MVSSHNFPEVSFFTFFFFVIQISQWNTNLIFFFHSSSFYSISRIFSNLLPYTRPPILSSSTQPLTGSKPTIPKQPFQPNPVSHTVAWSPLHTHKYPTIQFFDCIHGKKDFCLETNIKNHILSLSFSGNFHLHWSRETITNSAIMRT